MQKGLDYLLTKYSVEDKAVLDGEGFVEIGGEKYPLLPWESERRFIELRNLVLSGRLGNMCTYRIGHTAKKGTNLFNLLFREMGIVSFTLASPIKEVFAIGGINTMNCIVETENGCVCTIELGATLDKGEADVDKHEIITDSGVACDRVVDTQVPQSSIYVYGKQNALYTDTDAELYGYSEAQINTIRNAFLLASKNDARSAAQDKYEHIARAVAAAEKSLNTLENVKVGG